MGDTVSSIVQAKIEQIFQPSVSISSLERCSYSYGDKGVEVKRGEARGGERPYTGVVIIAT